MDAREWKTSDSCFHTKRIGVRSRVEIEFRVAAGTPVTPRRAHFRLSGARRGESRSACRRLGQGLLISAITFSSAVSSSVGEAMVLHQHGNRSVHLHTLGFGELRSDAASSPRFGHSSGTAPSPRTASQPVRILAIVATGLVFVTSYGTSGDDASRPDAVHHGPPFDAVEQPAPPSIEWFGVTPSAWGGRPALALLVQRSHTLLI